MPWRKDGWGRDFGAGEWGGNLIRGNLQRISSKTVICPSVMNIDAKCARLKRRKEKKHVHDGY